jgi:hypothetical protein
LIAGGSDNRDWSGALNSAEIFDPGTGEFTATAPLHNSRFKLPDEAIGLSSGAVLIVGGSKDVEVYDPKLRKFIIATGRLSDAWHYMTETKLNDGRVLLTGGYANNDRATNQSWIYRP